MRFYLLTVCGISLVAMMKGIIWEIFKKEKNITSSVSLSWDINETNLQRFFVFLNVVLKRFGEHCDPSGRILRISSDGDDRMGLKI